MIQPKHLLRCIVAAASVAAVACAGTPDGLARRVTFQASGGAKAFELVSRGQRVDVEDGGGRRLARLQIAEDRIAVEDGSGATIASILAPTAERTSYHVEDARGRSLYRLRIEPDGDLKVRSGDHTTLYELKKRDYGFKTLPAGGGDATRVRASSGRVSIRNDAGSTYLKTRDPIPVASVAVLALDDLPFAVAAGLAVAVAEWPPTP